MINIFILPPTAISILECLKQAMKAISTHKFRSILTILGVVVGTTTTIAVASIITGMNVRAIESMERFGTNVAFISKYNAGFQTQISREEEQRKELTYEDGEAIKKLPHIEEAVSCLGVWPGHPNAAVIKYKDHQANRPILRGGESNFFSVRSMFFKSGRSFTSTEDQHNIPVVVLGYDTANALFLNIEPIDKQIVINGQLFQVIGVLEKSTARGVLGETNWEDSAAIIPLGCFRKMYPQEHDYVVVAKATPGNLIPMVDEVTQLLRRRRQLSNDKADDFGISTSINSMESFTKISNLIGTIIIPISLMGFLIGGIGVLNIMLVSVTERTKEIGIRRALGARRYDIIIQFLIEAMSLTGLGGILGIIVGLIISWIINIFMTSIPSAVSTFWIFAGFLASVGVGLISGLWPAIKAAWLDPVEALRYE